MSERTDRRDSADWSTLIDRLNDVRLSRDWSYRQLADDIKHVTGFDISAQTLQTMLSVPPDERATPYDRTVHKIRLYLAEIEQSQESQKRRVIA